jgi:hypothetical protein
VFAVRAKKLESDGASLESFFVPLLWAAFSIRQLRYHHGK